MNMVKKNLKQLTLSSKLEDTPFNAGLEEEEEEGEGPGTAVFSWLSSDKAAVDSRARRVLFMILCLVDWSTSFAVVNSKIHVIIYPLKQ